MCNCKFRILGAYFIQERSSFIGVSKNPDCKNNDNNNIYFVVGSLFTSIYYMFHKFTKDVLINIYLIIILLDEYKGFLSLSERVGIYIRLDTVIRRMFSCISLRGKAEKIIR